MDGQSYCLRIKEFNTELRIQRENFIDKQHRRIHTHTIES